MSKICTRCLIDKPLTDFHQRASSVDGRTSWCKMCKKEYDSEYSVLNSAKKVAVMKQWKINNPERTRELGRAHSAKSRKTNPNLKRMSERKRRANKKTTETSLTTAEWSIILKTFNYECVYCPSRWEHMDHFIPLSKGGTHTADNVVPACGPCNLKKRDKDPLEFIGCR